MPHSIAPGLRVCVPEQWMNDEKGSFFEHFVAELLKPMGYQVVQRLRFTGMEIDLLAKHCHTPNKLLIECKATEDNLSADVLTKLLGNVTIRKVDAGWLFSTSDLTKDGRGLWEDIKNDHDTHQKVTWYPPNEIVNLLVSQGRVKTTEYVAGRAKLGSSLGAFTLIVNPQAWLWMVEVVENGIPAKVAFFDAATGNQLTEEELGALDPTISRLTTLELIVGTPSTPATATSQLAPVARVISGDSWDDPRPARPSDFVGRDDLIANITSFLDSVYEAETKTRVFSIEGPSGFGKSSLILKLADVIKNRKKFSVTAIDTRSASNALFALGALRTAFLDAQERSLIAKANPLQIQSAADPFDSHDLKTALDDLTKCKGVLVLIFDQFEELFAKEHLFDTFKQIRQLCLAFDSHQAPVVLGFAWKTDISLPQGHPAYHLWHELRDRRRSFGIREFGTKDIKRVIYKAERTFKTSLTSAIKSRLVEQCQGLPWLLKKLAVHIMRSLPSVESQYQLLERELNVKALFDEDLSHLSEPQLKCLDYIARNAPASVTEVESAFADVPGSLLQMHLIIRSGLNYSVYWDIFRDYLVEKKVPYIPWARSFQRDPKSAMRMLEQMIRSGPATLKEISQRMNVSEAGCQNILSDLFALQLTVSSMGSTQLLIMSMLRNFLKLWGR